MNVKPLTTYSEETATRVRELFWIFVGVGLVKVGNKSIMQHTNTNINPKAIAYITCKNVSKPGWATKFNICPIPNVYDPERELDGQQMSQYNGAMELFVKLSKKEEMK